ATRDLVRDPPRDRRRLARPGAGENADRPANRLDGPPLLVVQAREDALRVHPATVAGRSDGIRLDLCRKGVFERERFGDAGVARRTHHPGEPGDDLERLATLDQPLELGQLLVEPRAVDDG